MPRFAKSIAVQWQSFRREQVDPFAYSTLTGVSTVRSGVSKKIVLDLTLRHLATIQKFMPTLALRLPSGILTQPCPLLCREMRSSSSFSSRNLWVVPALYC